MEGDGVCNNRFYLRQEAGNGRHHETRRALTVDYGFNFISARFFDYLFHRSRMVIDGSFIERPFIRWQVDAGAPVFQPHVVTMINQLIDDGGFYWSAE